MSLFVKFEDLSVDNCKVGEGKSQPELIDTESDKTACKICRIFCKNRRKPLFVPLLFYNELEGIDGKKGKMKDVLSSGANGCQ